LRGLACFPHVLIPSGIGDSLSRNINITALGDFG